ncbi:MAG: circularly permuted type 2 ATP-grasp protein, partial [Mycobacterium sp.]|nr:circularly permuted type 2 ATP-grasp protein [Mycobacterium sp.]
GIGILESPGVLRFLPELAHQLLDETPLLRAVPSYWGGIDAERSHMLSNLPSLLVESIAGRESIVGPALSSTQREELAARIEAAPWQWVGRELPQFSSAPTGHYPGSLASASVGIRLFTVSQHGGYAAMGGGLGYLLAPGDAAYRLQTLAAKDIWVRPPTRAQAELTVKTAPPEALATAKPGGTRGISSPRVLSDLFWLGRYAERAESMARLLTVTRERYHEFRHRPDSDGSQSVPMLLTALGQLTGTDTDGPDLFATAPRLLWSLTVDRERSGSLAQSVQRLGEAARSVRDQMSNDTWMVLGGVERALAQLSPRGGDIAVSPVDDAALAAAHAQTLGGMLALSGVAAESVVRDVDWTMTDIGKRIERSIWLTTLLRATLARARSRSTEQTVIESLLVACESSVIYLRRNVGTVSVAAMADLVILDVENPRSLVYQLERLRAHLRTLPGASGSSRAERLVEEISTRLRRLDPADLDEVNPAGERTELADLLDGMHAGLRELSGVITATQLSLPGAMQPLWGPDRRRVVP